MVETIAEDTNAILVFRIGEDKFGNQQNFLPITLNEPLIYGHLYIYTKNIIENLLKTEFSGNIYVDAIIFNNKIKENIKVTLYSSETADRRDTSAQNLLEVNSKDGNIYIIPPKWNKQIRSFDFIANRSIEGFCKTIRRHNKNNETYNILLFFGLILVAYFVYNINIDSNKIISRK